MSYIPSIGGASIGRNVPTNPKIVDGTHYTDQRLYTVIHESDQSTTTTYTNHFLDSKQTLHTTAGYKIKIYDSLTQSGHQFSPADWDDTNKKFTAKDYFVLIHSDNHLEHHFAKITAVLTDDVLGDSIQFTPSLGKEIPKNSSYKLFTGPNINNNIVAISLGIKNNLATNLVVAKPLFYFYNEKLDKKNELDHSKKYAYVSTGIRSLTPQPVNPIPFMTARNYDGRIIDYSNHTLKADIIDNLKELDNIPAFRPNHNDGNYTFGVTATTGSPIFTGITDINCQTDLFVGMPISYGQVGTQVFSGSSNNIVVSSIQSASQFTASADSVITGAAVIGAYTSNEAKAFFTPSTFNDGVGDYDENLVNSRRGITDYRASGLYGQYRYVNYIHSPNVANMLNNVIENTTSESIGGVGGFSETKISDPNIIMSKKIKQGNSYSVRQRVHSENFDDWKEIPNAIIEDVATILGYKSITVNISNLSNYLVAGNEIRITNGGTNRIMIVRGVTDGQTNIGATDSTKSALVLENYFRLETDGAFTSSFPILNTEINIPIYRRALNPLNKTILTDFNLIENREKNLYIRCYGNNTSLIEFKVTSSNRNDKLLTLDSDLDSYDSELLNYVSGEYSIEVERFSGEVETIETYKESGQSLMRLSGRDSYNKLLSPIVNRNNLFSEDIIYSSDGPFVELVPIIHSSGTQITLSQHLNFGSTWIDTNIGCQILEEGQPAIDSNIAKGDNIYVVKTEGTKHIVDLIGRASTVSGLTTLILLEEKSLVSTFGTATDYKLYREKGNTYSFAKSLSSNSTGNSSTSLSGAADKGVLFAGGNTINYTGQEVKNLVTSKLSSDTKAKGYYLQSPSSVLTDNSFACKLSESSDLNNLTKFKTVNSLLDFSVVKVDKKDSSFEIEIAPYFPVTLGRVENNYANVPDAIFSTTDDNSVTIGTYDSGAGGTFLLLSALETNEGLMYNETHSWLNYKDPLYINKEFIGLYLGSRASPTGVMKLYLDRPLFKTFPINSQVQIIKKETQGSYYEYPKYSHELKLINAAHLNTGKVIGLLHPKLSNTSKPNYFNFNPINHNNSSEGSTSSIFGDSIYKINNIEKGSVNYKNNVVTETSKHITDYYKSPDYAKYYASAYKLNRGYSHSLGTTNQLFGINRTLSNKPHLPIEQRGITSVLGSKFFDAHILPSDLSRSNLIKGSRLEKTESNNASFSIPNPFSLATSMNLRASNADRLFLFITGDNRPYSSLRSDSLLNPNNLRSIMDYGILGINEPKLLSSSDTKDNFFVVTDRTGLIDEDFSLSSIYSNSDDIGSGGNNPKMFGLMRLTEIVLDTAFNQIDPEEEISTSKTIGRFDFPFVYSLTASPDINIGTNATRVNDTHITTTNDYTSGGNIIKTGDILVDISGNVYGKITSITSTQINFERILKTNGNDYHTGILRFIPCETNYFYGAGAEVTTDGFGGNIRGHGDKDTMMVTNDEADLNKTVLTKGFAFDTPDIDTVRIYFHDVYASSYYDEAIKNGSLIFKVSDSTSATSGNYHYFVIYFDEYEDGEESDTPAAPVFDATSCTTPPIADWPNIDMTTTGNGVSIGGGNSSQNDLYAAQQAGRLQFIGVTYDDEFYLSYGGFGDALGYIKGRVMQALQGNAEFMLRTKSLWSEGDYIGFSAAGGNVCLGRTYDDDTGAYDITEDITVKQPTNTAAANEGGFGGTGSKYSDNSTETQSQYMALLGGQSTNDSSQLRNLQRVTHSMLPYFLGYDIRKTSGSNPYNNFQSPSILIDILARAAITTDASNIGDSGDGRNETFMKGFLPIVLNTYDAEEETDVHVETGTVGSEIKSVMKRVFNANGIAARRIVALSLSLDEGLATNEDFLGTENTQQNEGKGVALGLKPRLLIDSSLSSGTSLGVGGKTVYSYVFEVGNGANNTTKSPLFNVNKWGWLNLVDLTGCYLASTEGEIDGVVQAANGKHSCNNLRPNVLANVLSHTIDCDSTSANGELKHIIITDTALPYDSYRILQPNPVCLTEKMDNSIVLNELSSKNTINPKTNKPYNGTYSYHVKSKKGGTNQGDNEAVLSMFVVLDIDGTDPTNDKVIVSNSTLPTVLSYIDNKEKALAVSDGEEINSTVLALTSNNNRYKLTFSKQEKLKGIVSISETIKLNVSSNFNPTNKRCLIGSTVKIGNEIEDLVDDLLERENIVFNNKKESYGVFSAVNFRGQPLLDAIKFLLDKKNKKLDFYNNEFRIIDKEDVNLRPDVHIDENSGVKIFEYETIKSSLDLYNEIILYGNSHKAIRKDLKSIQDKGRKTLEVLEEELTTQEEVDERALGLLLLHTQLDDRIKVTISHTNVSQIKAGDVINFGLKSEGVQKKLFIVLSVEYTLTGLIRLELGKYSRSLADRFSELLVTQNKTTTRQRLKNHPDASQGFNFLEDIKIKEVRVLARKRSSDNSLLGFATTLSTTGIPLGFEGTVIFTDLEEVDL